MRRMLLVPAAGRSVRMGGLLKELLPVGTRPPQTGLPALPAPVLSHVFECGLTAGVDAITVVVSSAKAPVLMEAIWAMQLPVPVYYIHQGDPTGLAGALMTAEPLIRGADVTLLLMPDTIIRPTDAPARAAEVVGGNTVAGVTVHRHEHPERFGVARLDSEDALVGFIDKPSDPPSNWVWTCVAFSPDFLPYVDRARPDRGEWGLTEALDFAAGKGAVTPYFVPDGGYYDVGTYEGYLEALRFLGRPGAELEWPWGATAP